MAYDKKKIYKQCVEAITKNKLFFIEDIVAFIPCNKDTFYRFFPTESEEYDTLKGMLDENKVIVKSGIRSKLFKGSKASELVPLYRLICTDEERRALSTQHLDHTTKGEKIDAKVNVSYNGEDINLKT